MKPLNPRPGHDRQEPRHPVAIEPGSRLERIVGLERPLVTLEVNSFHHQAADAVAPGLAISARAPDGVIEGLERPEHPFMIAVQWHPEELAAKHSAHQALFDALVLAAMEKLSHG